MERGVCRDRAEWYSHFPGACSYPGEKVWRRPGQTAGNDLVSEIVKYRDYVEDQRCQLWKQPSIPENQRDLLHPSRHYAGSRATASPAVLHKIWRKQHSFKATRACGPHSFTSTMSIYREEPRCPETLPPRRDGDRVN